MSQSWHEENSCSPWSWAGHYYNNDAGGPPPTNYVWWVVLVMLMNLIVDLRKQGLWQVTYTLSPASSYDPRPSLMRGTSLRLGNSLFVVTKELCVMLLAHIEIRHSAIVLCFTSPETWVVWRRLCIKKYQLLSSETFLIFKELVNWKILLQLLNDRITASN